MYWDKGIYKLDHEKETTMLQINLFKSIFII